MALSKEELKKYKSDWYQQDKIKKPEDRKKPNLCVREYLKKSGVYKLSWDNCKYYYIGQSKNLGIRYQKHLYGLAKQDGSNLKLQKLYNEFGKPKFTALRLCAVEELHKIETQFISECAQDEYNCNVLLDCELKISKPLPLESKIHALEKKINNGFTKKIYCYSGISGELILEDYGATNVIKRLNLIDLSVSGICTVLKNTNKTFKGFHFSYLKKTKHQVLEDIKYDNQKEEYKKKRSEAVLGNKNPMYGKKRPDIAKIRISEQEIINMHLNNVSSKEISIKANCSRVNVNCILRKNGYHVGQGGCIKKRNNIKDNELLQIL